jgi:hypothetical protein
MAGEESNRSRGTGRVSGLRIVGMCAKYIQVSFFKITKNLERAAEFKFC